MEWVSEWVLGVWLSWWVCVCEWIEWANGWFERGEWVRQWVGWWVDGCVGRCVGGWVKWQSGWVKEWGTSKWVNEWVGERTWKSRFSDFTAKSGNEWVIPFDKNYNFVLFVSYVYTLSAIFSWYVTDCRVSIIFSTITSICTCII